MTVVEAFTIRPVIELYNIKKTKYKYMIFAHCAVSTAVFLKYDRYGQ